MGQQGTGRFGIFGLGTPLRRWARALATPDSVPPAALREMAGEMAGLGAQLSGMSARAGHALRQRAGAAPIADRPDQCDWAMRPEPWCRPMRPRGHVGAASPTRLPGGLTLFHDARDPQVCLRQDPAPARPGGAPFGLVLEAYRFDGSFLSLVLDLPPEALEGLTLDHVVTARLVVDREQPVEFYARLNVQHGPNVETMVRQIELRDGAGCAEFDLAYTRINARKIEKAWLDLILEGPEMTRTALWDLTLLRAPRADI